MVQSNIQTGSYDEKPVRVNLVRWLARATSLISIGLIGLFFIGEGFNVRDVAAREWIGLLFFPVGVLSGLVLAWKRELLGALLSIGSLVCFYIVYGLLATGRFPKGWAFIAFAAPALFFLVSWILEKRPR